MSHKHEELGGNGLLRRAMKRLEYTNESLAAELTSVRTDGQSTSSATVSRWISGAAHAEPALVLYLKERLAQEAFSGATPRLSAPRRIAVGGGKGGSGASTVVSALALVADTLGYRVALRSYRDSCNNGWRRKRHSGQFALFNGAEHFDSTDFDFIITDLPSHMFISTDSVEQQIDSELLNQDLLVVPFGFGPDGDVAESVFEFLDDVKECPPWAGLLVCRWILMTELPCALEQFKPWWPLILERPVVYHSEPIRTEWPRWKFKSEPAFDAFYDVLEDICDRIGVSLREPLQSLESARSKPFSDLLDSLGA